MWIKPLDVKNKKIYLLLWLLCIAGTWSILPYAYYSSVFPKDVGSTVLVTLLTVQSGILYGIILWLSYLILPRTDLSPFVIGDLKKNIIYPGLVWGLVAGFSIFVLDRTVFHSSQLSGVTYPWWAGLIASLYGAMNEEVLLRLFLFSLVYFIFMKIFTLTVKNRIKFLWVANVIVALIFGIGHLPMASKLTTPTLLEVVRVLMLNGIAGIIFGWLYFNRGLWTAMAAHFVADLVLHVFM